jgi:pimeloyl-ACP methyl ester carboxylesterase
MLIYGRNDLIAPLEVGQWHLDSIDTPANNKSLIILENSRHGAEGEDIKIFQDAITNFINAI